ncbi:unnamed protein product [Amoebophrya sp. A25]|nr:unnamed protein product [Amoebophrya sp. A25]|eukprot:GSA25T00027565001.1
MSNDRGSNLRNRMNRIKMLQEVRSPSEELKIKEKDRPRREKDRISKEVIEPEGVNEE